MIVFSVYDEDDGSVYFATKREALRAARESAAYRGMDCEVQSHVVATGFSKRELAIRLLSGSGWSTETALVAAVSPKPFTRRMLRAAEKKEFSELTPREARELGRAENARLERERRP